MADAQPAAPGLTGKRFFSLKWKTLALVALALSVVHVSLVLQGYGEQLSEFSGQQSLAFEQRITVLQRLLEQTDARLQRVGNIVPGIVNAMTLGEGFAERWSGVQIELDFEVMQLYDKSGALIVDGMPDWGDAPPPEVRERLARALREERPSAMISCRPQCSQYAFVPGLGEGGKRQLMVLSVSLADVIVEFPRLAAADIAVLTEGGSGQAPYWGHYRVAAISDAPTNEPKLRALAQQATLEQIEEGVALTYGGRNYRFYGRPLQAFGATTPGHVLIFTDTTDLLADINDELRQQLIVGLTALLAAVLLLQMILNRPMNQLRKLAQALPMLASHEYGPARKLIGNAHERRETHTEIEVLEGVAVDLSNQLEDLQKTIATRSAALSEKISELHRAQELNETILGTAPVVIVMQSDKGEVVRVNGFGTTLLGYTEGELRGTTFVALMADAQQRQDCANALADLIAGRRQIYEQTGPVKCVDDTHERITWLHTRMQAGTDLYVLSVGLPDKSLAQLP